MSLFVYQAVDARGARTSGEIEAKSRGDALHKLEAGRLQPISVRPKPLGTGAGAGTAADDPDRNPASSFAEAGSLALNATQIVHFTDEISDLLDAGLQLEPALRLMSQRSELTKLKGVVARLREEIRDGVSFSVALRRTSASFGELYCRLAEAGELSGALPQILRRQSRFLAAMQELRSRVIQALIYPAFMTLAGAGLMVVFMVVLVPNLTMLFSKTGTEQPLLTRLLILSSNFIATWWWAVALAAGGLAFGFWSYIQTTEGRAWWDRAQLRLPLVGAVISSRYYVQLSQTLATMVGSGIPLLNALRLMEAATGNTHLRGQLSRVVAMVSEGGTLSRAFQRVGEFPPTLIDMVAVGEQTGDLSTSLEKIGTRYDKELNIKIQRLTAIIQPTIVLVMALVVGVVAFSMITGIFSAVSGLKAH
ncbi:general secretion pathway protein F [Verrucomicrobium sp. GAS474]|uniref:type II secretion system F family protein n=1 Tax=Verrucomicrobium sp. GAS474 TaxID=1882831 RepID=UPI00087B19B3|nr:type II secretion system F family protein [Verrucomicrobium sp. GAS474]SDU06495.1 general secretion pathway protein F [Verrucomicrobium sp. GAS474]